MKIIVAGMMKTGMNTLTAALRMLGYDVCDFMHHVENWRAWQKIFTSGGTTEDFFQLFKDTDAVVNIPAFYFWDKILEAFPDCKVSPGLCIKIIFLMKSVCCIYGCKSE